jgi:phenolic acid decarboxylase
MVYNLGLEVRIEAWKNKQESVHKYELMKQVTQIRDIEWIKDVPVSALQNSVERLDKTYKVFFRGGGFPKWANKKLYKSICFKQDTNRRVVILGKDRQKDCRYCTTKSEMFARIFCTRNLHDLQKKTIPLFWRT